MRFPKLWLVVSMAGALSACVGSRGSRGPSFYATRMHGALGERDVSTVVRAVGTVPLSQRWPKAQADAFQVIDASSWGGAVFTVTLTETGGELEIKEWDPGLRKKRSGRKVLTTAEGARLKRAIDAVERSGYFRGNVEPRKLGETVIVDGGTSFIELVRGEVALTGFASRHPDSPAVLALFRELCRLEREMGL